MKFDVQRIKRERIIKGWSQTRFAELLNLVPSTISMIESGQSNGSPETIKSMADLLGLPMQELIIDEKSA